jgi:hypothetical protein
VRPRILLVLASAAVAAGSIVSPSTTTAAAAGRSVQEPFCEAHVGSCPDVWTHQDYEGEYVGHDEPALLFYSKRAGSGNTNVWNLRLPREAPAMPAQDGSGGTWGFQQRAAFWFGMALCETQSYPNPGVPCRADSDANIADAADPTAPDWVGNHVGTGFMELQFFPPGWVPVSVGTSCDATQWCAALAVFGLSDSTTQTNNDDCLNRAGEEWVDFAFLTTSGLPQAPPDPLGSTARTFLPDPSQALFMDPGDEVRISIHDSPDGLTAAVRDDTTGETGSMTASTANGFAHPLFQPSATTCSESPYAFHPMYSTSGPHTRVPWAAHSYNVSFSDEIGHFEYCDQVNAQRSCVDPGVTEPKVDGDDHTCFDASRSLLVPVGGCLATDTDFDGVSYQPDWPGSLSDPTIDGQVHSESVLFTSPLTGGVNFGRVAFEADMPAIERSCNGRTGVGCVNPPPGARFYPIYTTTGSGACGWHQGGTHIPGTVRTFGGSSVTEYKNLSALVYPGFAWAPGTVSVYQNYRRVVSPNPCVSTGSLPG